MSFVLVPPTHQVTGASYASSNVIEVQPNPWNGAVTYAAGATVTVPVLPASGLLDVYESLAGGNLNKAPATEPTWWKKLSAVYQEWANGSTYVKGARVQVTSLHKVYESLQAGNTGKDPAADVEAEWWGEVGSTNKWALFDESPASQTARADLIDVTVAVNDPIDTVLFDNLDAAAVRFTRTHPVEGVIDDIEVDLNDDSGIVDWLTQWTLPIVRKRFAYFTQLTAVGNLQLRLQIKAPGGEARVGLVYHGLAREIGETQWGGSVGRRSRTRIVEDDFGKQKAVKRPSSKRGEFTVRVPGTAVDGVIDLLDQYDGVPVFIIASPRYGSTGIYGFIRDHNTVLEADFHSFLSIQTQGLV